MSDKERDPEDVNDKRPTPEEIENAYWKRAHGTTSLAARGYRSFWE
jgi:hypothetical protein